MKKILLILTVLFSTFTFAQTNGITYQAVIYNANGESVPGIKNSNTPLSNQEICLQFSILNDLTLTEYQEKISVTTDAYGMVNLVIGNGIQTGGFANSFGAIVWNSTNKFLKIGLNQTGSCDSFEEISYQLLNYVPFAFAATSATSVSGVVGLANGGTNATTVIGAKTNLQLHNVDNTRDLDKPISTLTQLALDAKVDKVAGKNFSTEDFSTAEKTKLASISGTNTGDQDLSSFATTTDLVSKVDKVTGKELSTNDFTTVEKTKLAAISGTNTGDQDLSSFATTTDLASKVDKVTGKELSTNDFTTVEKTKLAAISGTNTGDQDLSSFATTTDLASKVDKVTGKELSTNDFTTAEKTKLASISGTNTGDQDLSLFATLLSPSFTGTPIAPTAVSSTNTTQVATTAFVNNAVANKFVDMSSNQTIAGVKAFNSDLIANGIIIGKGKGQNNYNTVLGVGALDSSNANGTRNTAIGYLALTQYAGTTFDNNTGVGYFNMIGLTTGYGNTSIGAETMFNVGASSNNTGIGNQSLINAAGDNNVGVGARSGDGLTTGTNNTFIGTQARTTSAGATISNATALGFGAVVTENNTIQLGNLSVTNVKTIGSFTGSGFKTPAGTSTQYLMADGSVSSSTLSNYLPISGGNMTGQLSIGTTIPESSAVLNITSTTQGFLPPRMKQSQRNTINNPIAGLVIWCQNCGANGELQVYNGITWTNMIGGIASVVPINVGDSYGGGTVIYLFQSGDLGYIAGEFHGIIVANEDAGYSPWGCNGVTTSAVGSSVGAATQNTSNIIASNCGSSAAQFCIEYRGGGYTDWVLPSINELNIVFTNRSFLPSSLSQYLYWSSTEISSAVAYRKDMRYANTGGVQSFGKTSHSHVRAVRYF